MRFRQIDFRFFSAIAVIAAYGIAVTTPVEAEIFGNSFESVAITGFSASPSSIVEGQNTTLSWTTLEATDCTPTGGAGNWSQTIITLPGGSAELTINTAGTYQFTLTCQGTTGDPVVENTTVTVFKKVAITGFSASPLTITEGQSTTLSWTTQDATECTPTGGAGNWNQMIITLPDGSVDLTINTTGTHQFTLTCQGGAGDSVVENATLTVYKKVAITGFSASPSTITEGQSTTLSWTTLDATECTPTGGAGDWSQTIITLPGGSVDLTLNTADTYQFTLTCQGAAGDSAVENTTVVVDAAVSGCDAPALSLSVETLWKDFWLVAFPGPISDNKLKAVPKNGYSALKFNTGDVVDDGKLSLQELTSVTGLRRGTITECPGDFNFNFDNDPTNCSFVWGLGGGIRWATNGRSGACQLKANTDYYFNVTFTDGTDDTTSSCEPNNAQKLCRVEIRHSNPP